MMTECIRTTAILPPELLSDVHDRDTIICSAVRLFSQSDYDQVGLSMIARDAGLTEKQIVHHFDSKEELFAATVEEALGSMISPTGDGVTLSRYVINALAAGITAGEADNSLKLILRGAANARSVDIVRRSIELRFQRPLANSLTGENDGQRAALLLAVLAGFQVAWTVMGVGRSSSGFDPAILSRHLASLLQALIEPSGMNGADR